MSKKSTTWAARQIQGPKIVTEPRDRKTFVLDSSEVILPDDYPVYADYVYICDGAVTISHIQGDVGRLKASGGFKVVRSFALFVGRTGVHVGDRIEDVKREGTAA